MCRAVIGSGCCVLRAVIVVSVIIVGIAACLVCDRIVAVPLVEMTRIPVIADIAVIGPETSQADEDESAMIERIHVIEVVIMAPAIMYRVAITRPYNPADKTLMTVPECMLITKTPRSVIAVLVSDSPCCNRLNVNGIVVT